MKALFILNSAVEASFTSLSALTQRVNNIWRGRRRLPRATGKRFVKREDLDAGSGNNFSTRSGGGTTAAPSCRGCPSILTAEFRIILFIAPIFFLSAQPTTTPPPPLTQFERAQLQIGLEQRHFSCGFIDGREGKRTTRAIAAFQENQKLPITGTLDSNTKNLLQPLSDPFTYLTITESDLLQITPPLSTWIEKSQQKTLGFHSLWELVAERHHAAQRFIKELNPSITEPKLGDQLLVPNLQGSLPLPKIDSLRITLSETSIQGFDLTGLIQCHFACSIAADKQKRPTGTLTVKNYAPNPNYTFDPELFKAAALQEKITKKLIIPPGPNNPVGTAWIGLSLPGYGIHGTPIPEEISATQSHGCFRLCNWNAEKLLKMIRIGMTVSIQE